MGHVLYVDEHRWLGVCIAQAGLFSMDFGTRWFVRACGAFRQQAFPSMTFVGGFPSASRSFLELDSFGYCSSQGTGISRPVPPPPRSAGYEPMSASDAKGVTAPGVAQRAGRWVYIPRPRPYSEPESSTHTRHHPWPNSSKIPLPPWPWSLSAVRTYAALQKPTCPPSRKSS